MRSLLLAALLLLSLCAVGLTDDKKKPKEKEKDVDYPSGRVLVDTSLPALIPYTDQGGLLVLKAAIGDGDISTAIVDTGLPLSALTPTLAEKQKLKPKADMEFHTLIGPAKGGQVDAQQIKLGTVTIVDVPFVVCDMFAHLSSEKKTDQPPIWLGASAFSGLVMSIDPSRQSISFQPATVNLPDKASVSTLELKNGHWYVDIRINDRKNVRALVDTGAVGMLLPAKAAKDLGLTNPSTVTATTKLPSGKDGKVALTKLASVAIGSAKANNVPAIYVMEGDTTGLEPDTAIVGTDFLLRFKVTMHFPKRKIAFEPLANPLDQAAMRMINGGNPAGNPRVNPSGTGPTPIRVRPGAGNNRPPIGAGGGYSGGNP